MSGEGSAQPLSLDELLLEAESLRPRTMGERFSDAASEFAGGLLEVPAGLVDAIAIGSQALDRWADPDVSLEEKPIEASRLGRSIRGLAESLYPRSGKIERGLSDELAGALGSGAGFMVGGASGALAKIPVMASAAFLGGAGAAAGQFYEAKAHGASDEEALKAYALGMGVEGPTEALGVGRLLSRVDRSSGGALRRLLFHTALTGVEEGAQEVAAGAVHNLIARHLVGYDEDRALAEGLFREGELGALTGLILGGLHGAAVIRARGPSGDGGGTLPGASPLGVEGTLPQEAPGSLQAGTSPQAAPPPSAEPISPQARNGGPSIEEEYIGLEPGEKPPTREEEEAREERRASPELQALLEEAGAVQEERVMGPMRALTRSVAARAGLAEGTLESEDAQFRPIEERSSLGPLEEETGALEETVRRLEAGEDLPGFEGGARKEVLPGPSAVKTSGPKSEEGPAAKTPAEVVTPPDEPAKTTGIKNATVDRELAQMGFEPAVHGEGTSFEAAHLAAKAKLEKDPFAGQKLVLDLRESSRAPSAEEDALLAFELNRLINERDLAEESFLEDPSEANQARVERSRAEYASAADVVTLAGTKSGQSLAFRKMMLARDFSLAAMERRAAVANKGKALTEAQEAEIRRLHGELKGAQERHEAYVTAQGERSQKLEAENAALRVSKRRRARARSIEKSKARIEELFSELAKHTGVEAQTGLDPKTLKLTAELALEHVKLGYQSFAQWADEVAARLGEEIRPYLESAWKKAQGDRRLKAYKARAKREAEELRARTEREDPRGPREPLLQDEEAVRLRADLAEARIAYEQMLERIRLRNRTPKEKALDRAKEALDLPRALITAYDFSALLRQGAFFTLGHPIETARVHLPRMLKAFASERKSLELEAELGARPLFPFAKESGLELTELGADLTKGEEAIRSRFSDRVPLVRASSRAFTALLNSQRMAAFEAMVGAIPGTPTKEQGKALANFANIATGRGNMGKMAPAMGLLSRTLWSPRLLVSRFQALLGQPLWRGDAFTRRKIAKEYARFLIGLSGVYALAAVAGADIEEDPRSSDFGKLRFGRTRVDPLAGLSQVSVFTSRLVSGKTKRSTSGELFPIRGKIPYGKDSSADVIARFLRTKLTPLLGTTIDVLSGENVVGEEVTPGSVLENLVVPLSFRDIKDAMEEHGVPTTAALGILSIFGWGMQTYGEKPKAELPE